MLLQCKLHFEYWGQWLFQNNAYLNKNKHAHLPLLCAAVAAAAAPPLTAAAVPLIAVEAAVRRRPQPHSTCAANLCWGCRLLAKAARVLLLAMAACMLTLAGVFAAFAAAAAAAPAALVDVHVDASARLPAPPASRSPTSVAAYSSPEAGHPG